VSGGRELREVDGDRLIQSHPAGPGKPYIKIVGGPKQLDSEARLGRLRASVQALAASPDDQVAIYPEFTATADELGLDFEHWLTVCRPLLSEEQQVSLNALDRLLDDMSGQGEPWTRHDLRTDERWERIRAMAKDSLNVVGWPLENPPKSPDLYVEFDK
jgi:hypothetical protein